MSEWVYLINKEPEFNHDGYLITDGKTVSFGYWDTSDFVGVECIYMNKITHWMPLPKPPN